MTNDTQALIRRCVGYADEWEIRNSDKGVLVCPPHRTLNTLRAIDEFYRGQDDD